MSSKRGRQNQLQTSSNRGGGSWRTNSRAPSQASAETQSQSQLRTQQQQVQNGGRGYRGGVGRSRGNLRTAPLSRMDLIASVSRSSGLEKGGDDLKDFKIQEEYREFVQGKLDQLMKNHFPRRYLLETEGERKQRIDGQENVLILFRKLREGISASKRNDAFGLEVYETSLFLAVIFDSPRQPASIIPHLIPGVYQNASCPQPLRLASLVLSLLYHLVIAYPSQGTYHQHRGSIPPSLLPKDSKAAKWLSSLTRALRTRNYTQFERLSRKSNIAFIFDDGSITGTLAFESLVNSRPQASREFAHMAILIGLDTLRTKARDSFWTVVRSAYREVTCSLKTSTKPWLSRSLCLQSLLSEDLTLETEAWLAQQTELGHTRKAEGVEGKWIICKVR